MSDSELTQYSTWYVAMIAAGTVIAAPAGATGHTHFFLVGVGLVLVGVGEFINHPYRENIVPGPYYAPLWKVSGRSRAVNLTGLLFDASGCLLALYGLVRIIIA